MWTAHSAPFDAASPRFRHSSVTSATYSGVECTILHTHPAGGAGTTNQPGSDGEVLASRPNERAQAMRNAQTRSRTCRSVTVPSPRRSESVKSSH